MSRTRTLLVCIALAGAPIGCQSAVEGEAPSHTDATSSGTTSGATSSTTGGTAGTGGVEPGAPEEVTRVARLTHDQYDATVQDLFGISDSPAAAFAPDALNGFGFDTSIDLEVDARLGPHYRTAAEALAERAVSDDEIFGEIVPCSPDEADCADAFIAEFGMRAFRRPLTPDEQDAFLVLFQQGPTLVMTGDAFRDGVRLVVEAMLQSPHFLYRTELSTAADANGMIALTSWEIATRLAYFVQGSMPTDALFERASRDELRTVEQIRSAVEELLMSERANAQLVSFHAQAWNFNRYSRIAPDRDVFANAPTDIVDSSRIASEHFVRDVIENGGGLSELLTAPYAFADAGLAALYGLEGDAVPSSMARIDLDAGQRKGYLMQIGFLASHAYAVDTDPIHRGVFVLRQLLCRDIPDPPPGASMTPLPETDEPIETTREEIELLTGQAGCFTCHLQINPPGFALEGFDAVGQVRTRENDVPVDTSGTLELDDVDVAFSGPLELVDALAASQEARACYASKWLEFAYGRSLAAGDDAAIAELGATALSVHELLARVSTTEAFMKRKPNEVGP
ncbi:MAG TPA: DUF1592 domain-containing protein [Polyangiaceae bacterium]|nr:DUF1592 domain-containing protein [Polyangiaceae bacterium]